MFSGCPRPFGQLIRRRVHLLAMFHPLVPNVAAFLQPPSLLGIEYPAVPSHISTSPDISSWALRASQYMARSQLRRSNRQTMRSHLPSGEGVAISCLRSMQIRLPCHSLDLDMSTVGPYTEPCSRSKKSTVLGSISSGRRPCCSKCATTGQIGSRFRNSRQQVSGIHDRRIGLKL